MSIQISVPKLLDLFNEIHQNKYDYSKFVYIKMKEKSIVICPAHGEFFITPEKHSKRKQGCSRCVNKNKTKEEIVNELNIVHNNKYDYSQLIYTESRALVDIICPVHGIFKLSHDKHKSGRGCPKCVIISYESRTRTIDKFIEMAKDVHGDRYDYSQVIYKNTRTPIDIICKKHGTFSQVPNSHLYGIGCPICSASKGEIMISNILDDFGVKYIREKKFDDCKNPETGWKFKFDFYLPDYNMVIEYHGLQHYKQAYFGKKKGKTIEEIEKLSNDKLLKTQKNDQIKEIYCNNNNLKYLVIPYDNPILTLKMICDPNNQD